MPNSKTSEECKTTCLNSVPCFMLVGVVPVVPREVLLEALQEEVHPVVVEEQHPEVLSLEGDILRRMLPVRVKAEECATVNTKAVFQFTDTKEAFTLHLRNGILDVTKGSAEAWDLKLETTAEVWRGVLSKERSAVAAYTSGDIVIEGGVLSFRSFMGCLEQEQ